MSCLTTDNSTHLIGGYKLKKYKVLHDIIESGVVAVIRAESKEEGKKIIEAVKEGGVRALEITLTVPGAVDIIKELVEEYKDQDVIIGAGTVLDPESARLCILAGAKYIVSPYFDLETVKMCNRYAVPIMPGVMNPKEVVMALEAGVDICKVFPADVFGPNIISAFKGPLPQGNYMPTGGVDLSNVKEWIKKGAVAVGVGSVMTKGAKTGNFEEVKETARKFVELVKEARAELK